MARKPNAMVPAPRRDPDEKLTITEVCTELKITRSTFYDWRAKGRAPRCSKLPNPWKFTSAQQIVSWLDSSARHR